jgi:phospholipid transport system transporter-binding protein
MTEACSIRRGEDGCARLAGELTFESVPGLYVHAQNELPENIVTVDLSGVTAADSAGLALLLEWQASRKNSSAALTFTNAPSSLMSLASLSEATGLLNISGRT